MSRERAIVFVDLRPPSRRLTRKFERRIGDRSLLAWVIEGLRACREIDEIVCVSADTEDGTQLAELARSAEVRCVTSNNQEYEGDALFARLARELLAGVAVVVRADEPLVDCAALDALIVQLRDSSTSRDSCPLAARAAKHFHHRLLAELPASNHSRRLRVDTWADLEFMNALFDGLQSSDERFELPAALRYLKREPLLAKLNEHVADCGADAPREQALFIADAGGEVGFGHLMRCRELALQLTERTGRPVLFLVDDEEALKRLDECGLAAEWGAFERPVRNAEPAREALDALDAAKSSALVVLDLFGKRSLSPGWHNRLGRPTLVLDRAETWCEEADCLVVPGVTYPDEWTLPMQLGGAGIPLHGGIDYIIQRREIRKVAIGRSERDIDILAYLYGEKERGLLREFGAKHALATRILEKAAPDFPSLLARSRVFVSGFGITFYEALALGTQPVVWPLSREHELDALRFFRAFGLTPTVIQSAQDLPALLNLLRTRAPQPSAVADGTPRIVDLIEGLLSPSHSTAAAEEVVQ